MIHMVTYSSDNMTRSRELCYTSSLKYGVDHVFSYGRSDLDEIFVLSNRKTLSHERGAGYWIWKPYVVNKVLQRLNEGDILIYADSGVEFVAPVGEIISRMDEDIFFFTNGWRHVEWCKGNVLRAIIPEHAEDVTKKQLQASVVFFRVNDRTRSFVHEWLLWSQMPGFIDDSPGEGNYITFAEHRHDQAILTSLQIREGYSHHWWPTQYSYHLPRESRDNYPVMFNHHRKRNDQW